VNKGCEAETLANLAQLASADWSKAAGVAWAAASKTTIKNPNSWVNQACRERLKELGLWLPR
jgi:hypothetical protein